MELIFRRTFITKGERGELTTPNRIFPWVLLHSNLAGATGLSRSTPLDDITRTSASILPYVLFKYKFASGFLSSSSASVFDEKPESERKDGGAGRELSMFQVPLIASCFLIMKLKLDGGGPGGGAKDGDVGVNMVDGGVLGSSGVV